MKIKHFFKKWRIFPRFSLSLKDASGILAGVVARPPESPYDTLVLAAGKNAGVTLGMEVFGAAAFRSASFHRFFPIFLA